MSSLADLVTQAPDPKAKASIEEPATGGGCRCFRWRRSSQPRLAAVVPAPPEEETLPTAPPPLLEALEKAAFAEGAVAAAATAAAAWPEGVPEAAQLGLQVGADVGKKTLVLDLDETLVHSSFRAVYSADIVISVELDGEQHRIYVRKRPGVDAFLKEVARLYEVVVYTASMAKYANPLLDELDREKVVSHRLFREACTRYPSGYVKDLSRLGRSLKDVIIIDNSPTCYALQPHNAIPIRTWRDDPSDHELLDLIPILSSLAVVEDIPMVLGQIVWSPDD